MAYDSARGKVVLFSGLDASSAAISDMWEWDGTARTWTEITVTGTKPSARNDAAMAYDSERHKLMLFGGNDGALKQDMWEFDGETGAWSDVTPIGVKPSKRNRVSMAYDRMRAKLVLFGGFDGSAMSGETWEWDCTLGSWAQITPVSASPVPGGWFGMDFDPGTGRTVLYGGMSLTDMLYQTWEWNGPQRPGRRSHPDRSYRRRAVFTRLLSTDMESKCFSEGTNSGPLRSTRISGSGSKTAVSGARSAGPSRRLPLDSAT